MPTHVQVPEDCLFSLVFAGKATTRPGDGGTGGGVEGPSGLGGEPASNGCLCLLTIE